jgi:hypothetical protein
MSYYTVVTSEEASDFDNPDHTLTVDYLRWQGLLFEECVVPLADILKKTHGQCNPRSAFYIFSTVSSIVHASDGQVLLGFHDVVDDVNARGLRRV